MSKTRVCPICRKPRSEEFAPFCSSRCRDRDLAKWFGDDPRCPHEPRCHHGGKADPARTEDRDGLTITDLERRDYRPGASDYSAAERGEFLERQVPVHLHRRALRHDRVGCERRLAEEVRVQLLVAAA